MASPCCAMGTKNVTPRKAADEISHAVGLGCRNISLPGSKRKLASRRQPRARQEPGRIECAAADCRPPHPFDIAAGGRHVGNAFPADLRCPAFLETSPGYASDPFESG